MTEGTKLGEFKENQEFKTAIKNEGGEELPGEGFQATRIGEMSDFEKSLYEENVPERAERKSQSTPKEASSGKSPEVKASKPRKTENDRDPDTIFQHELDRLVVDYAEGDIIKGVVRSVEKSGVLVDISYKSDGFIANSEFSNDSSVVPSEAVKPGDEVKVFIVKLESKEGYTVLSKKRADYELAWTELTRLAKTRDSVIVKVVSKVQGGLVAEYNGIKGFIPASQVLEDGEENLDAFVGREMEVCVLQSDRRRRKVIFSYRLGRLKNKKSESSKLLMELEVGQTRKGKVTSIKDFGVFVDLGGVEGLVHISELSWSRVNHPSEVVKAGDEVNVFILGVDRESNKISLGMKQLEPDPWVKVAENYAIGQVISGKISRITSFGAFIRLQDDLEGLIHISELSYDHVDRVEDVVKVGQEVQARIIKLIPDEQKIGLSLKGVESGSGKSARSVADSPDTGDHA